MPETRRILLIEDSSCEVELFMHGIAEAGLGNAVDVVRDGDEALDYLNMRGKYADRTEGYPVVILLDIKLLKMDVRELLKQLKTTEKINCIPVVVFTGSQSEQDIIQTYAYGANSYVLKPFSAQDLFEVIKDVGLYWTVTSQPPPVEKCKLP